jgi:hypothetical protein
MSLGGTSRVHLPRAAAATRFLVPRPAASTSSIAATSQGFSELAQFRWFAEQDVDVGGERVETAGSYLNQHLVCLDGARRGARIGQVWNR